MNKLLLPLLLLFTTVLSAHQPDLSTTLLVARPDGQWQLHLVGSLTAFEYAVDTRFGRGAYTSPEGFADLVVDHLLATLSLRHYGDGAAKLTDGRVSLGHETTVSFNVAGLPATLERLGVTNTAFAGIHRNRSALVVVDGDGDRRQYELHAGNDHTAELIFGDPGLRALAVTPQFSNLVAGLSTLAALSLLAVIWVVVSERWRGRT